MTTIPSLIRSQQTAEEILEPTPMMKLRRRVFKNHSFLIGALILIVIITIAVLAPFIAPHDPYDQDLSRRLINPFWHDKKTADLYVFGTDKVGRDYLSRVIYGAQISLLIGFLTVLISGVIGTALGVIAGYFGGRVDMVVNFIINTRLAMPVFLVAMAAVVAFGASIHVVIMVLGLFLWDRFAVVMRSITMQARDLDYVKAARAIGCSTPYIIIREIFPNVLPALLAYSLVGLPVLIILESTLSFLGLGVEIPTASWGGMINQARQDLLINIWPAVWPAVTLFMTVYSFNNLADWVRTQAATRSAAI